MASQPTQQTPAEDPAFEDATDTLAVPTVDSNARGRATRSQTRAQSSRTPATTSTAPTPAPNPPLAQPAARTKPKRRGGRGGSNRSSRASSRASADSTPEQILSEIARLQEALRVARELRDADTRATVVPSIERERLAPSLVPATERGRSVLPPDTLRRFETPGALAGQFFGGEERKSVVKIDNPKPFTGTSSGPSLATWVHLTFDRMVTHAYSFPSEESARATLFLYI
ncbi:hypothetical protein F4861DRAFT_543436 [Xylaria intraflava]|nr:hypothetical protein F4861DRAFT_543436 [Xylaria intraflava]